MVCIEKKFHPFVWLKRFRHRKGYGIHSPFAFEYVTYVIYEHTPYYSYKDLEQEEQRLKTVKSEEWTCNESRKLKRLLFRMVNRAQPNMIVEAGSPTAATLYLQGGKKGATYYAISNAEELGNLHGNHIDFLYLHSADAQWMKGILSKSLPLAHTHSVFAVQGIGYNKASKALWDEVKRAPGVGITFDLYDLGILMFDPEYHKQDYIINF